MRVLGIDLGLKRSGLAVSDSEGLSIKLLDNLMATNQKDAVDKIIALVRLYSAEAVVIGKPQVLSKSSETIAIRAESLCSALEKAKYETADLAALDVTLWDESFSSKKAMSNLVQSGVPRKKRQEKLDAAAAAVLVEDYLYWHMTKA